MKRFVCSIVLLLLCDVFIQAQEKSDREKDNLIGKVNSLHIYMSGFSNQNGAYVEDDKRHTENYCYDKDGKRSSAKQDYTSSFCTVPGLGEKEEKEEVRINEKGFKVRTLFISFHKSDLIPPSKHVYTYDQQERLLSYIVYEGNDILVLKLLHTYNEKGDLAQSEYYDETNEVTLRQTFTYEYDSVGNWVKLTAKKRESGEAQEVPFAVRYRTIIYHSE